jgi:hypothetical protein
MGTFVKSGKSKGTENQRGQARLIITKTSDKLAYPLFFQEGLPSRVFFLYCAGEEMLAILLIFAAISGVAQLRGRKSPLYGAAGVVLYYIIGIPVYEWTTKVEGVSSSWWASHFGAVAISGAVAVIAVSFFILLLPSKNLREGAVQTSVPYLGFGILTMILSCGCWLMWIGLTGSQDTEAKSAFAFLGILLFGASVTCFRFHRQQQAPSAEAALATDLRAPILFLRSFQEDQNRIKSGSWLASWFPWTEDAYHRKVGQTFEEWLSPVLKTLGPFIAVGDPKDYLPSLGAARVYSDDANWRKIVTDFVARANLILLVEGLTPGLEWELGAVKKQLGHFLLGRIV